MKNGSEFLYEKDDNKWARVPFGLGDVINYLGEEYTVVAFSLDQDDAEYNIVKSGKANTITLREFDTDEQEFNVQILDSDFIDSTKKYALGGSLNNFTYTVGGI